MCPSRGRRTCHMTSPYSLMNTILMSKDPKFNNSELSSSNHIQCEYLSSQIWSLQCCHVRREVSLEMLLIWSNTAGPSSALALSNDSNDIVAQVSWFASANSLEYLLYAVHGYSYLCGRSRTITKIIHSLVASILIKLGPSLSSGSWASNRAQNCLSFRQDEDGEIAQHSTNDRKCWWVDKHSCSQYVTKPIRPFAGAPHKGQG